ncbi:MAG: hypothetical protein AAF696_33315 [Bacteroidota bacterium]
MWAEHPFDTLEIDATTKVIGQHSHFDKTEKYKKFNFILENPSDIRRFVSGLELGAEVRNFYERPNFKLLVIKNHKKIGNWTINPLDSSILTHDGHTYEFDVSTLSELYKEFPLDYSYEKIAFSSKEEYESYLIQQKRKSNFLYSISPAFKFEGSFKIKFKKSKKFPHPRAVSDFLAPFVEEIVDPKNYSISFDMNEQISTNNRQFTAIVQGPYILYQELQIDNFNKENWKPTEENAYFFYKLN